MHILHVIPTLDPATGGPPAVAARLAAAQASLAHEVTLFSVDDPGRSTAISDSLRPIPSWRSVRHVSIRPQRAWRLPSCGPHVGQALRESCRQVDIVHIHGVWEPLNFQAAAVAHRHNVPYVVAPHGMLDPWSLHQKRWKKQIALALGYRRMLMRAAWIHVLNADEDRLMDPLRLQVRRVILPNGVFLEEIEPTPERSRFRAAHPEVGTDPLVLFLSRLHHKKGLDYLAKAFELLAQRHLTVRLVVAGPDDGARASFEQQVRTAKLTNRVHIVGPLYGRSKFEAMVDSTCFCLPSRQEGFSVAVTEALACGLPAVISDACHFPEVSTARAGFVTPLEPSAIADALSTIIDDAAIQRSMAEAAKRLIASRFTWPIIARDALRAYEEAIAQPKQT